MFMYSCETPVTPSPTAGSGRGRTPDADTCDVFFADPARVERVRAALIGTRQVTALAETFRALGDPTRVRILDALSRDELCVCDLATLLGLTESAVSHQLRLLRALRLVRTRRDGRMAFYALDDQHIVTLFHQGLRHVDEAAGADAKGPGR
jgi:ArsR family transcriptional regulator, lead/cadmium/zinc/bismuth-responsive transcriptional repressor